MKMGRLPRGWQIGDFVAPFSLLSPTTLSPPRLLPGAPGFTPGDVGLGTAGCGEGVSFDLQPPTSRFPLQSELFHA